MMPHSGIQFLDFAFRLDGSVRLNRAFLEEDDEGGEGKVLHALIAEEGEQLHPTTRAPVEPSYTLNAQRALEPFLETWIPLPFMRILGRDAAGRDVFDQGPSNWARLFIAETEAADDSADKAYRAVLAFDTELSDKPRAPDRPYTAPTLTDAATEQTFGFSAQDDDVAWFVAEGWVDQWLEEAFHDMHRKRDRNRRFKPENLPQAVEHTARYLTLLSLLELVCRLPKI